MDKFSIPSVISELDSVGYIATPDIAYAICGTIFDRIPLLIEGDPGCGKTFLAKAVAKMMGMKLIRVQMYDGITYDKILYDYDYQRQLLTIEAIRSSLGKTLADKTPEEAMKIAGRINFYDKDFLIQRPVLQALTSNEPVVLLLDEVDKTSEELEYSLLEVLDEFSMTIPQYGTIRCKEENRPMVFMTSNNYRELSDALKRRCNYLYIKNKTREEVEKILLRKTNIGEQAASVVANCLVELQAAHMKQVPSISEGIAWVNYLVEHPDISEEDFSESAFLLAKNKQDTATAKRILAAEAPEVQSALRQG